MRTTKCTILILVFILMVQSLGLSSIAVANTRGSISLDLKGADVIDVFRVLADVSRLNIVVDPSVKGTLTVRLKDVSTDEALALVSRAAGVQYRVVGNTVVVGPQDVLAKGFDHISIRKFELKNASASDIRSSLEFIAPPGQLHVDSRTNSIIARGTVEQMAKVEELIAMLDVAIPVPPAEPKPVVQSSPERELHIFNLKHTGAQSMKDALALVMPAASIQVDSRTNSVLLMALPSELPRAKEMIQALDVQLPPPPPAPAPAVVAPPEETIEVITLTHSQAQRVRDTLSVLVDPKKMQVDERTNSIVMIVDASTRKKALDLIAKLDVDVRKPQDLLPAQPMARPAEPEMVEMIRLYHAHPGKVRETLSLLIPRERIAVDERLNALLVKGTAGDIERVRRIAALLDEQVLLQEPEIESGQQDQAPTPEPVLKIFRLQHTDAASVRTALGLIVAPGSMQVESRTNSLLALIPEADSVRIDEIIKALDVPAASKTAPAPPPAVESAEVVVLRYAQASRVRETLSVVVPSNKMQVDERTNSIVILGDEGSRARAKDIIARIDVDVPKPAPAPVVARPEPEAEVVEVIKLSHASPQSVRDALAVILPPGKVGTDTRSNSVIVLATPSMHRTVEDIVAKLDVPVPVVSVPEPVKDQGAFETVEVVKLRYARPSDVKTALGVVIPSNKMTVDERTNTLIIIANAEARARAMAIIDWLDVEVPVTSAPEPSKDQGAVETVEVIRLKHAKPSEVRAALASVIPSGKMTADERTNTLIIIANAEARARAMAIIQQLDIDVPVAAEPAPVKDQSPVESVEIIKLKHARATEAKGVLSTVVPPAKMTVDERTNTLIMIANTEAKAKALAIIAQIDVEVPKAPAPVAPAPPPGNPVELGVYRVNHASLDGMRAALSLVVPESRIQTDPRTATVLVHAERSTLGLVEAIIQRLDVPVIAPASVERVVAADRTQVYRLSHAAPSDVARALSLIVSAERMQADDRTRSLVMRVPQDRMDEINNIVASLDVPSVTPADHDPVVTRIYRLNYASPDDLRNVLSGVLEAHVSTDVRTSSLVVSAKESEHKRAIGLIEILDEELAQVLIEARLQEISADASRRLGIDWTFSGISLSQNAFGQWATVSLDFLANLAALEDKGDAVLLSRQHTFTVDGKAGKILIGDRVPVVTQTVQDGQVVDRVEFINAGIELTITPKVSHDGTITATVKPVISSIVGWTPQYYPQIRTRELETIVSVKNGQTVVIGGLLHRDEIDSVAKVPILGDIPILGELFKKRTREVKNTEIIVLITAWVVRPGQRPVVAPATKTEKFPVVVDEAPAPKK